MKKQLIETTRMPYTLAAISLLITGMLVAQAAYARPSLGALQQQIDAVKSDVDNLQNDVDTKQNRITGVCPPGASIGAVNANGSVACEADDDTTYSAGDGLDLQGTTFSVEPTPAFRARMPAGQILSHNTEAILNFSTQEYDSANVYDPVARQFIVPETGFYQLTCSILPSTPIINGNVRLQIAVPGSNDVVQVYGPHPNFQTISVSTQKYLFGGQRVSCNFYTNANGAGNNFSISSSFSRFSGFRIN